MFGIADQKLRIKYNNFYIIIGNIRISLILKTEKICSLLNIIVTFGADNKLIFR